MQQIQTHQLDSDVGPGVLQSGAAQTLMKRNSDVPEALAVITWRLWASARHRTAEQYLWDLDMKITHIKKPETFSHKLSLKVNFSVKIIGRALRSGLLAQLTVRWSQRRAAPSLKTVLDSPSSRHLWRISPSFLWFSCCFSPRHAAVAGHQYPACSWAADTAGARGYRLAAVFTDRYRSSAWMLARLSLYLLSQFIVLGVDGPSNCVWCYCGWMTRRVCLLVINRRCEYKWYPQITFSWIFKSHGRKR